MQSKMLRVTSRIIFTALIYISSVVAHAQVFNPNEIPVAAPQKWVSLFGEYVFTDKKVLIRENNARIEAIWAPDPRYPEKSGEVWPLSELEANKFTYSFKGKFANFIFQFDDAGQGRAIVIGDDVYERHYIEPRDGQSFKVTLDKTIEEYTEDALKASPPKQEGDFREPDLIDVTTVLDKVKLDIRYATTNNFLNVATYSQAKSFLQRPALMALNNANIRLNDLGFGILIHDTYRPWYVTKIFWDTTEGAERDFVANPESGSKHNMGSAVDMTLYDLKSGEVIKMVGTYDEMSDRSYPEYPGGSSRERWHRDLLRIIMESEGFKVVSNEWWHFDYKDWQKYPILNKTFEELLKTN